MTAEFPFSFWNYLWPWKGPFCWCRTMTVDARSVHRQLSHRLWVEHAIAWLLHRRYSDWTGSTLPRDAPSDVQRHLSCYDILALGERSKLCNRPDWGRVAIFPLFAAWKLDFLSLPFKSPYLALRTTKSLEIWQAYFHTYLVDECQILKNLDNPFRRYKRLNLSRFFLDRVYNSNYIL